MITTLTLAEYHALVFGIGMPHKFEFGKVHKLGDVIVPTFNVEMEEGIFNNPGQAQVDVGFKKQGNTSIMVLKEKTCTR